MKISQNSRWEYRVQNIQSPVLGSTAILILFDVGLGDSSGHDYSGYKN